MRSKGRVVTWHDDKGYGFVAPFPDGPEVFLHIKAIRNRSRRPVVGDVVTYTRAVDGSGRPQARDAVLAGVPKSAPRSRSGGKTARHAVPIAVSFLAAVGASSLMTGLPFAVVLAYVAMSLVTFLAYGFDKSAAMNGRWRTSETMLHVLALAGGWPGALVARHTMRHKTIKQPFRSVFWLTVLLNCAFLAWLHVGQGRHFLDTLAALT